MGYSSAVDIVVDIRKDKVKELRQKLEESKAKDNREEWEHEISDMMVDNHGCIMFPDYDRNWYHDGEWCVFLAPYVTKGKIEFTGEDGMRWGYDYDGKGNVFELIYRTERGKKLRRFV